MKILVGICGIGNGHLSRQTNVINYLLSKKNEIVIATTENNIKYFEKKFKNTKVLKINIPWISCDINGIDFNDSLQKYSEKNIDQFESFLKFSINVENAFGEIPDIVITDYEPNVAQYSYAVNIPLICMEQQSKFLSLKEIKIENFSILEEQKRINYFFPKFSYKIISSFFPIKTNDKRIKIVTPIISKLNIKLNKKIIYLYIFHHMKIHQIILKY